jgi:hypothetical protein
LGDPKVTIKEEDHEGFFKEDFQEKKDKSI